MANNQFTGLLQQYGLPGISEQELAMHRRQEQIRQRIAGANQPNAGVVPADQPFYDLGEKLGILVGNKLSPAPDPVSQAEKLQIAAVADATARFEQQQALAQESESYDPGRAQAEYEKLVGEALLRRGQVDKGAQMVSNAQQRLMALEKQRKELVKLGLENTETGVDIETKVFDLEKNKFMLERGESGTVWPKGSRDPNSGVTAFIDPRTGAAMVAGPNGPEAAFELGEYTSVRPSRDPQEPRGGGEGGTRARDFVTPRELSRIREMPQNLTRQMRVAVRMRQALADSVSENGTVDILSTTGAATRGFVSTIDNLTGVARNFGRTLSLTDGAGKGRELSRAKDASAYTRRNLAEFDRNLKQYVPAEIRNDKKNRERWYAAMVQLTYARARAEEPGARQLSDEDFKRALAGVAASTTSPETFQRVTFENVLTDIQSVQDAALMLPEGVGRGVIMSEAAWEHFENEVEAFRDVFDPERVGTFGSQTAPGEALVDRPEEAPTVELDDETLGIMNKYQPDE